MPHIKGWITFPHMLNAACTDILVTDGSVTSYRNLTAENIMLKHFVDQESRQASREMACLCSTVSGASARRPEPWRLQPSHSSLTTSGS